MGQPSYMRSVVDRNVVMRPMTVPSRLQCHQVREITVYRPSDNKSQPACQGNRSFLSGTRLTPCCHGNRCHKLVYIL